MNMLGGIRTALVDALTRGDEETLQSLLVGQGESVEGLDPADLIRRALPVDERPRWDARLCDLIAHRLAALAAIDRQWTALETEEAWNAVVLLEGLQNAHRCTAGLVALEEHLRRWPDPPVRKDLPLAIEYAFIYAQTDGQLIPRWQAVLDTEYDPERLFRAFLGLIRAGGQQQAPAVDAPLALIRQGLTKLWERLRAHPAADQFLVDAARAIREAYPAREGFWYEQLADVVEPMSPPASHRVSAQLGDPDAVVRRIVEASLERTGRADLAGQSAVVLETLRRWLQQGIPMNAAGEITQWGEQFPGLSASRLARYLGGKKLVAALEHQGPQTRASDVSYSYSSHASPYSQPSAPTALYFGARKPKDEK
jgi:hypothetical protein